MAEAGVAGAGADQGPPAAGGPGGAGPGAPRAGPDWAGLPEHVLMKVAEKHIAQTEAGWAAQLKLDRLSRKERKKAMAKRQSDGNCLLIFAMVCKNWRKAQLRVGGPLRTRVKSDVILPGQVALAKWALAEGCPRESGSDSPTMAYFAALYEHTELAQWLCEEQGFPTDDADAGKQSAELWRRRAPKRFKKMLKERYARSDEEFLPALKRYIEAGGSLAPGDLSPQYRELVWQALQPLHTRRGLPAPFGWAAPAAPAGPMDGLFMQHVGVKRAYAVVHANWAASQLSSSDDE